MPMLTQLQVPSPRTLHPLHHTYSHTNSIHSFIHPHDRAEDDPSHCRDAFEGDGLHDEPQHHDIHSPSKVSPTVEQEWSHESRPWSTTSDFYDPKHETTKTFEKEKEEEEEDDEQEEEEEEVDGGETPIFPLTTTIGTKRTSKKKVEVFTCPEEHCGKSFPRSFALRRHMRIHTGMKPYPCDFEGCTQRFNTSGNLSRHKRIHSGERPYPCVFTTCGKRFNTSTKLKRHMRIHFPEGQNLFQCLNTGCTFACDNYKEYIHHQRSHGNLSYMDMPSSETIHSSGMKRDMESGFMGLSSADVPERRLFGLSTPSGMSLLLKDSQRETDRDTDYGHHDPLLRYPLMKTPSNHSQHEDRPRLPFLSEAFPSDSIVSASPMNGSGFSSSFMSHFGGHNGQHHPLRPSFLYESSNPSGSPFMHRNHFNENFSHLSYNHSTTFSSSSPRNESEEGDDSPATVDHHEHGTGQHNPEFTGEELSVVLELMNA